MALAPRRTARPVNALCTATLDGQPMHAPAPHAAALEQRLRGIEGHRARSVELRWTEGTGAKATTRSEPVPTRRERDADPNPDRPEGRPTMLITHDARTLAWAMAGLITERPARARHLIGRAPGATTTTGARARARTINLVTGDKATITDRCLWLDHLGLRGLDDRQGLASELESLPDGASLHFLTATPAQSAGVTYALLERLRTECAAQITAHAPFRTLRGQHLRVADGRAAARAIIAEAQAHPPDPGAVNALRTAQATLTRDEDDEARTPHAERLHELAHRLGEITHVAPPARPRWRDGQPAPADIDDTETGFQMTFFGTETDEATCVNTRILTADPQEFWPNRSANLLIVR